jgi:hypothetical protein
MKLLLIVLLAITNITSSFACCNAGQYKIYPLGYQNEILIVAEYKMSRKCEIGDGAGINNEFHWTVIVNLSYINADSSIVIQNIDTLSFMDCVCDFRDVDEKSTVLFQLLPSYQESLREAKKLLGFKGLSPVSYATVEEIDINEDFQFIDSDTSSVLYYKGQLKELKPINWAACGFLNSIQELRRYTFENKQIIIINLSCAAAGDLPPEKVLRNRQNFESIETAITYTPTQWHGLSMDFLIEY